MRDLSIRRVALFHFAFVLTFYAGLATAPSVNAASNHAIYAVKPDGDLLYYAYRGASNSANSWGPTAVQIGNGWNFRQVFSGGDGVIFAITDSGDLMYYKYLGVNNGSASWGRGGVKIGNGWNFRQVFSGGDGVIFAVADNFDLLYYKYLGMRDGSNSWGRTNVKIGNGWNFREVFPGGSGVIFAITESSDLLYYKFQGFGLGKSPPPVWAPASQNKIGNGWSFRKVFSGGDGAIFSIAADGDLFFHKFLGMADGAFRWGTDSGVKVGNGWNFAHVFAELTPATAAAAGSGPAAPGDAKPPPANAYRTSAWSSWSRADGVQYRYRWGWDPSDSRYSKDVDAIFEMKNLQRGVWDGSARSIDCHQNTVSMGTDVRLQPNQTRQVKFRTPNCGTLQSPEFRPNVVRAGRVD